MTLSIMSAIKAILYYSTPELRLLLKFKYCEKATKFCEIFTLLLSYVVPVKSTVKIAQNVLAFSEYMNFSRFSTIRSNVRKHRKVVLAMAFFLITRGCSALA